MSISFNTRVRLLGASLAAVVSLSAGAQEPPSKTLASTPPMGWISWGQFHEHIDEQLMRQNVDALVASGLRDAGYEYFIIDGGWKAPRRDAAGNLQADPRAFPSGIKALADYVHSKHLKFGVHHPVGETDCRGASPGTQSAPGSSYAEKARRDAATLAAWGVDYLKFDRCRFAFPEGTVPGAPDLDRITVRRGETTIVAREAESPTNVVRGGARISTCARCSGGKMVEAIGIDNGSVELANIAVPEAGEYEIGLSCMFVNRGQYDRSWTKESYAVSVGVNSAPPALLRHEATRPEDGTVFTLTTTARLEAGNNTIRIANPHSEEEVLRHAYVAMGQALREAGRPMIYSLSGPPRPWLWAPKIAQLARTGFDNVPWWDSGRRGQSTPATVVTAIDVNEPLAAYAGPGYWNDPDMLETGVDLPDPHGRFIGHLTPEEGRSQFAMWAMMAAPLLLSADLRHLPADTRAIFLNKDIIAVDQDPLGKQGTRVRVDPGPAQARADREVWVKPLANGDRAVALFNRSSETAPMSTTAEEIGLTPAASYAVRDLWRHTTHSTTREIRASVPAHGVALFRVSAGARSTASR